MTERGQEGSMRGVLVSDFDGTMTTHDFYRLALESLVPKNVPDYWSEYRRGQITHFEALRRYFSSIRKTEDEVMEVVWKMELDPGLGQAIEQLHRAGWKVIVASAGCEWYISKWLARAGVTLVVHANPGCFLEGEGLVMELPTASPYFSPSLGIDKTAIVRTYLDRGTPVAYAGDGFPDVAPAKLVSEDLRFARADLAASLKQEELRFHGYDSWSEIARFLIDRNS